jgi:hypothetical protein
MSKQGQVFILDKSWWWVKNEYLPHPAKFSLDFSVSNPPFPLEQEEVTERPRLDLILL